jgi:hypothetical protein
MGTVIDLMQFLREMCVSFQVANRKVLGSIMHLKITVMSENCEAHNSKTVFHAVSKSRDNKT